MNCQRYLLSIAAVVLTAAPIISAQNSEAQTSTSQTTANQTTSQPPTQPTTPPPKPTPTPAVVAVSTYSRKELCSPKCQAGIGDKIVVQIENLPAVEGPNVKPIEYVLFLDGQPIPGVKGIPVNGAEIYPEPVKAEKGKPPLNLFFLEFELKRTDDDASRAAWAGLLGSPSFKKPSRPVNVSVGPPGKDPFPFAANSKPEILLRAYHRGWLIGTSLGVLLAILLFAYLAKSTNIIRDSNPPSPPEGKKRPYSLALTQASVWFFLVFGSFLFIGLVTGDYDTITEQALILMGIGTGTALGAAMIDNTKRNTADTALSSLEPKKAQLEEEVKQLDANVKSLATTAATAEEKQALADASVKLKETEAHLQDVVRDIADAKSGLSKPISEGFFRDLLTDADGVNIHRFQMVIWTIVLGVLFVIGVYKALAMPEFSATLLALMGISSGTYLGFKIPEKQS